MNKFVNFMRDYVFARSVIPIGIIVIAIGIYASTIYGDRKDYPRCEATVTDSELLNIVKTLSPRLNVRINKAGNITVSDPKEICGYWTLYNVENSQFLWRRHDGYGYCYPLNMHGRKRIGEIYHETYDGKTYSWYHRSWDKQNCMFSSVENALDYFVKYLKKYRNINI